MNGQRWTPLEIARLEEMIASGTNYTTIAKRLRRSVHAVRCAASHHSLTTARKQSSYTANQLTALFGYADRGSVVRWIDLGYLRGRNRSRQSTLWHVSYDDLLTFLEDETMWMLWTPAQLNDADWRAYTTDLRADAPRWLSVPQAAAQIACGETTVNAAIRDGRLPAVRRHKFWWIRETDAAAFVLPSLRPASRVSCAVCGAVIQERGRWKHEAWSKQHRAALQVTS